MKSNLSLLGALLATCLSVVIIGCESEDARAERERIACLDSACPGEQAPLQNPETERVFKLDGRWFVAPKEYGDRNLVFYWPSKNPQTIWADSEQGKSFYDVAIEIFLERPPSPPAGVSGHEFLRQAEAEGRVHSKTVLRPGLTVWRMKGTYGAADGIWYAAVDPSDPDALIPLLNCREVDTARCTTAFMWRPGIRADLRFHSRHGSDWPEIHQEVIRVLSLVQGIER